MSGHFSETNSIWYDDDDDEPQPATPHVLRWMARICVALAAVFFLSAVLEHRRAIAFDLSAVQTVGTVENKWSHRNWTWIKRPRYTSTHRNNYIIVQFNSEDDRKHAYRISIDRTRWSQLEIGSRIPVWYVPSEPANFEIDQRFRLSQEWPLGIVGLIFLGISGWYMFDYLATRGRPRQFNIELRRRLEQRRKVRAQNKSRTSAISKPAW
jgi:hypothetical protein